MILLYATIWLSMVLFAAGESGRSFASRGEAPPRWAWWAFTLGLGLAIVHTLLSFGIVHDWSHTDAVNVTARQTAAIYGVAFGGGLYVNYLFLATWLGDSVWWRISGAASGPILWLLRALYLVIIGNAAIVFASGWRRIFGAVLVSWLVRVWARQLTTAAHQQHPRSSAAGRTESRRKVVP